MTYDQFLWDNLWMEKTCPHCSHTIVHVGEMIQQVWSFFSIYKFTEVYESLGIEFGEYSRLKPSKVKGSIVIISPDDIESDEVVSIEKKKVAVIAESTEVEKLSIKSKFNADTVITLSNHADYNDLIEFIDLVEPKKVYLVQQNANQFAQVLQDRGHDAISLEKPTQLNLL